MATPTPTRCLYTGLLSLILALLVSGQDLAGVSAPPSWPGGSTSAYFQGWYLAPPRTMEIGCAHSHSWSTTESWADCCDLSDGCSQGPATACSAGVVTYYNGETEVCGSDYANCYTMTIHASYPAGPDSESWYQMFCGAQWTIHDIYRDVVITTPVTADSTAAPSSAPSAAGGVMLTFTGPTRITEFPSPTNKPEGSSRAGTSPGSPATTGMPIIPGPAPPDLRWIAGAVLGPLALLGIVVAGMFFFLRMRRRKLDNLKNIKGNGEQGPPDDYYNIGGANSSPRGVDEAPGQGTVSLSLEPKSELEAPFYSGLPSHDTSQANFAELDPGVQVQGRHLGGAELPATPIRPL